MRVLVPILGALALAALLVLWLRPGRERVSAPQAGRVQVAVSSPESVVELAQASAITSEPAGAPENDRRELVETPDETVTGCVEVEGGIPLGDEPVIVAHAHRPGASRLHSRRIEAPVARDGSFAFGVPAGTRSVSVELESLVLSLPDEVEVRAGSRDVLLRPELRAAVRGWAHRPSRYPIGPSTCEEEPIRVTCVGSGAIDADPGGGFWFMIAAGTPVVLQAATGSHESGAESVRASARLELEALQPGEIREVDLFLEPWVAPHGVVTDHSGVPIEGALILIDLPSDSFRPNAWHLAKQTGADGRFVLEPLGPGPRELLARTRGRFGGRRAIVLPADGYEELRFVLGPPATVRGRVVRPDDKPCEGAIVSDIRTPQVLTPSESGSEWSTSGYHGTHNVHTSPDGSFTFVGDTDTALLVARMPGFAPSLPLEIELSSGVEKDGVVLRLRRGCSLSGRAFDEDGAPVSVLLKFRSVDGTEVVLEADGAGVFAAHDLPPGSARIETAVLTRQEEHSFLSYEGTAEVELAPDLEARVELRLKRTE